MLRDEQNDDFDLKKTSSEGREVINEINVLKFLLVVVVLLLVVVVVVMVMIGLVLLSLW